MVLLFTLIFLVSCPRPALADGEVLVNVVDAALKESLEKTLVVNLVAEPPDIIPDGVSRSMQVVT